MERFRIIVYAQNGLFSLICILFVLFFREKPKAPPSKLSLIFRQLSQSGIREDIKTLSKNRNFVFNLVVFSCVWGNYITLGNVLTPLFGPQFTSAEISLIGMIFVVTGAIGCFLMGTWLDKTKQYLFAIRFITTCLLCLCLLALILLPMGKLWITCIFAFLIGLLSVPILPACY